MPDQFASVMTTIDRMEKLAHQPEPVTPTSVAQGVRTVYHDQGLPLDEGLLQQALAPEQVPATLPTPASETVAPPVKGGLGLVDILLALAMVGVMVIMTLTMSRHMREVAARDHLTGLSMTLVENHQTALGTGQPAVDPPLAEVQAIFQDLGVAHLHPDAATLLAVDQVEAEQCRVIESAWFPFLQEPGSGLSVEVNGVSATSVAAAMALSCATKGNHLALHITDTATP
jgi:hypothetical protein